MIRDILLESCAPDWDFVEGLATYLNLRREFMLRLNCDIGFLLAVTMSSGMLVFQLFNYGIDRKDLQDWLREGRMERLIQTNKTNKTIGALTAGRLTRPGNGISSTMRDGSLCCAFRVQFF